MSFASDLAAALRRDTPAFAGPDPRDAVARLDEGVELPGDEALAEQYDAACRTDWDAHTLRQIEQAEADYRAWWAATFGGDEEDS